MLTHFEARRKRAVAPTAAGLMVGAGRAVHKSNRWLFDDIRNSLVDLRTGADQPVAVRRYPNEEPQLAGGGLPGHG